jgi:hypothetical protein
MFPIVLEFPKEQIFDVYKLAIVVFVILASRLVRDVIFVFEMVESVANKF